VSENLTEAESHALEIELIRVIGRQPIGPLTNQTDGGEGTSGARLVFSEKHREALSRAAQRRFEDPVQRAWLLELQHRSLPFAHSPEANEKQAATKRGKKQSNETRKKRAESISKAHADGKYNESYVKIGDTHRGRPNPAARGKLRPDTSALMRNLVWVTNGILRKRVPPDQIPDGWRRGRK
jgi:hypothetical protein